jgi:transcriptional regulator with XRE-family HTH domain
MESLVLFGRRVRSVREATGKSRESLAEGASITPNYLGEIERGEKWPSLEVIVALAGALAVSPTTFFELESEEVDPRFLLARLDEILKSRSVEQLQQAVRVLKALFQI